MTKPCWQTRFYPELNLSVGSGSLLCTKGETGCEEDKELITSTRNCSDTLHSGFAEAGFAASLQEQALCVFSPSSGTRQIMLCKSHARCPGGCTEPCLKQDR